MVGMEANKVNTGVSISSLFYIFDPNRNMASLDTIPPEWRVNVDILAVKFSNLLSLEWSERVWTAFESTIKLQNKNGEFKV